MNEQQAQKRAEEVAWNNGTIEELLEGWVGK